LFLLQTFGYALSDALSRVHQAPHQQAHQAPHQKVDPADLQDAELIDWACIPDFNEEIVCEQPQQQLKPQDQQVDPADLEAAENMDWDNLPDFDETTTPLRSFLTKLVEKGESQAQTSAPREGSWEACERDWTPGMFMV
jgi:hypothetical protein